MKVLGTQDIEFCEVKSDEEINKKYLDKFLQYSLLQNLIEKSKNAKVYYHYFRSKKKYFIYINQKQGEVYIVPEILFTLNLEKDKYYLLFYKNYFYLYLNNKIIFFQKYNSSESSEEDIKNFLKFVYDVEIFDKAYINEEEFNILLFKKNEKSKIKCLKSPSLFLLTISMF